MLREPVAGTPFGVEGVPEGGRTQPMRALLASGRKETQAWGKRWLEQFGFQVTVAVSLDDAAAILAAGVDVAILDAAVPRTDSGPAWVALRHMPGGAEVPILGLCSSPAEARRGVAEGCTDVMRKPVEWQLLSQRAIRLVTAHRASTELALTRTELDTLRQSCRAEHQPDPAAPLDALTGLPQRRTFEQVLEGGLAGSLRAGSNLAVIFLDLDRFKLINGTYGRLGGSQLLVQVAERLRGCLRKRELVGPRRVGLATAAVARLGGDAFALMVSPVGPREEVALIAQAVLDALSHPCTVNDEDVYASASIGIATAPADGTTAEELLQRAELAMAEAGRRGGSAYRFYSRGLSDARERAMKMDSLLRRTLEKNELSLHYQPIIDVRSRRIVGAEALLRWHSPELGNVPPMEFIPVAEETGFMVDIGAWVIRTAVRQLRQWLAEGVDPIRMAMNVSLCQLTRGNLPELVDEALAEGDLDPSLLELELSERGVLRSDPEILRQLVAVRKRGVRVSVDDFGTGDSAIAYLKKFPLDTLKVDQSFVAGALSNEDDAAITSAMIAMAHRLRLRVVAEGVEQLQQVELLEKLDCEEIQGFYFSPPVPPTEFRALLERA